MAWKKNAWHILFKFFSIVFFGGVNFRSNVVLSSIHIITIRFCIVLECSFSHSVPFFVANNIINLRFCFAAALFTHFLLSKYF